MPKTLTPPYLTVCIDAETRMIVAHHIDCEPAGIGSALPVLQQAVQWDATACPREVLVDRSPFHSLALAPALADPDGGGTTDADPQS